MDMSRGYADRAQREERKGGKRRVVTMSRAENPMVQKQRGVPKSQQQRGA